VGALYGNMCGENVCNNYNASDLSKKQSFAVLLCHRRKVFQGRSMKRTL